MMSQRLRLAIGVLCLLVGLSALICCVLPIIGSGGLAAKFNIRYTIADHFRLLAGQLVGPGFTLLSAGILGVVLFRRKQLPWWIWLPVLVGPFYTDKAVGGLSHDFSHTVFNECSGIYGTWISFASAVAAGGLIGITVCGWIIRRIERESMTAEQAAGSDH